MNEYYAIIDLDGYVTSIRESAAKSISSSTNDENLNDYITLNQVKNLVEHWSLGCDVEGRFLLDEETHQGIFEDIKTWIINVGLAKLASNNELECAWDSNTNTMIFWISEQKKENNERKSTSKNQ